MRFIIIFISLLLLISLQSCPHGHYDDGETIFIRNKTLDTVFIGVVFSKTYPISIRDFKTAYNVMHKVNPMQYGYEVVDKTHRLYYKIFVFKKSTIERFHKEDIIEYQIADTILPLTFDGFDARDFQIVYNGESQWQHRSDIPQSNPK